MTGRGAATFLRTAAMLAALAAPAAAQQADFASAPVKAANSAARLLSAGAPVGGVYHAGVEIELQPGVVTYWRQPGDAGAPPVFDFSGSENLAAAEPSYPVPKHIEEAGSLVAGYDRTVIFPLRVTPKDPAAPVVLKLALNYAACGKICLPARAELTLALPKSGASPHAGAIAAAEAATPRRLSEAEAQQRVAATRMGADAWRVTLRDKGPIADLFAEAPDPLYLEGSRAGDGGFEVKLVQGKKPEGGVAATLTILTATGALEAPLRLE